MYIYVRVYMRVRVCECVFFCVRFFVGVRVCVGTALCTAFVARKMLRSSVATKETYILSKEINTL